MPLDKMVTISATTFENVFSCIRCIVSIEISLQFIAFDQISNIPALVQIMAWRRPGDKPLPEPMLTRFTDAYMRHLGEMS